MTARVHAEDSIPGRNQLRNEEAVFTAHISQRWDTHYEWTLT
jgi:hypothetical protein